MTLYSVIRFATMGFNLQQIPIPIKFPELQGKHLEEG